MIDLSGLNENQIEAVTWRNGPLLVLAGPGSGKTRVLTFRIAQILEESAGEHFRVLALTFTNKAAAEMRGRVEMLVPNALDRVRLTTFHSYAAELLQQHGNHINLRPDFQILTNDADREAVLDEVLREMDKDQKYSLPTHFKAGQLLPAITKLLDRCVAIDQAEGVLEESGSENAVPLAQVYGAYRDALKRTNSLDFPSLIAETIELLKKHPPLVKHVRKVYKHLLVDEFQDTNASQYQILSLLAAPNPSTLFVVADDDQIIYQWNGASPKRIKALQDEFKVHELQLPENYRCPPAVIELANALISKNLYRSAGKKPLKAVKTGVHADGLRVFKFDTLDGEAAWVAEDIASRAEAEREKCAILARTKKVLDVIGTKLGEVGVPVYYAARKDEFKSAPLRMLHAILRLANTQEDKQSLARLCKAFFEIEGVRIELPVIFSRASADGIDYLRAWLEEVQKRSRNVSADTRNLLASGMKPLLGSLSYRTFAVALLDWAEKRQNTPQAGEDAFNEFEEERVVWRQLQAEIMKKFEGEDVGLHQFLHELDLSSKTPPREKGAIPCFTIHASKGMEFGHVYLVALVEDQLPSWAAIKKGDDSLEMQEERRNCFVAITRTQESLTLTFAGEVFGWRKQPSRFLREMRIEI